jgi:peroxiredoxin
MPLPAPPSPQNAAALHAIGARIPSVIFKCRVRDETLPGPNPFKWKDVTTEELFKGKRVVLFALPGGDCLRDPLLRR